GRLYEEVIDDALNIVGKSGQVTITAVGNGKRNHHPGILIGYQRRLQGAIFGGCNPLYDVPRLLSLYRTGDLKLDELITRRNRLQEVNQGYQDMYDGKNIRGVIIYEHWGAADEHPPLRVGDQLSRDPADHRERAPDRWRVGAGCQ